MIDPFGDDRQPPVIDRQFEPAAGLAQGADAVRDARDAAIALVQDRVKRGAPVRGAEVDDAIRFAQGVDGPALVWFEIAEEQNVFPMMPAGKGLSDLIEKWGGADE